MVTAIPDDCWKLDHWSGAITGSGNPISVELNKYSGDTSVTAHFVASALIAVDDDCDGDVDGLDLAALAAQGAAITAEDVAALAATLGEIP